MFKDIVTSKKYWKTTVFLALGFIVIFTFIEFMMSYDEAGANAFLEERIHNGKWVRFLISRIVGGLLYGMIMGYYFEIKRKKSN